MLISQKIRRFVRTFLRKLARRIDPPHPDQTLGNITYAQHGEDIVLHNLFNQLHIQFPNYLDIGAHHPTRISNTALMYEHGSRGVNVEANPHLIDAFLDLRPDDVTINAAVADKVGEIDFYLIDDYSGRNTCDANTAKAFVEKYPEFKISRTIKVTTISIEQIYRDHFEPAEIDLLSIDVEGLDQLILESALSHGIRPKVIVIEVVSGADDSNAQDIRHLLEGNGYFIHIRLAANYIAVRSEFRNALL